MISWKCIQFCVTNIHMMDNAQKKSKWKTTKKGEEIQKIFKHQHQTNSRVIADYCSCVECRYGQPNSTQSMNKKNTINRSIYMSLFLSRAMISKHSKLSFETKKKKIHFCLFFGQKCKMLAGAFWMVRCI